MNKQDAEMAQMRSSSKPVVSNGPVVDAKANKVIAKPVSDSAKKDSKKPTECKTNLVTKVQPVVVVVDKQRAEPVYGDADSDLVKMLEYYKQVQAQLENKLKKLQSEEQTILLGRSGLDGVASTSIQTV
jgi:membrane-associated HD superfamily phosphohydrolase